jgi:hypothetical protein
MLSDWLISLTTHNIEAVNPWAECQLCHERIRAGEREGRRLRNAGADERQYRDAEHKPRYATLVEHDEAVAASKGRRP